MPQLDGWTVQDDKKLTKSYTFPDFVQALAFVNRAGAVAEGEGHHPDLFLTWGKVGVGICWDQWYPECARGMMLLGADVLLYPTAIGSEPHNSALDTRDRWHRAQQGHATSNVVPVAAANRVGSENGQKYYGSSFITDQTGAIVQQLDRDEEGVLVQSFDIQKIAGERAAWGFFRDMRCPG